MPPRIERRRNRRPRSVKPVANSAPADGWFSGHTRRLTRPSRGVLPQMGSVSESALPSLAAIVHTRNAEGDEPSDAFSWGGGGTMSVPRSREGPVAATQSDRVPELPSRRLVASALICPLVKLPVRSLRRRHLHPYPRCLASRFEPVRWRLLHDFPRATSRLRLLPRAGLSSPVVVVPLGAVYRSCLSAAMHATAGAREGGGALLCVPAGTPLVEAKARTAEALLCGVVTSLHIRSSRSKPPSRLLPVCANERRHGFGVPSSTARFVTCHRSVAPPCPMSASKPPIPGREAA